MLPSSTLLLSSSFLSGCNKDVLFNLRVSSLTEPDLYKHASELLEVVTGSVMADRNDKRLSPRASGGSGAPSFADFSSFREMIREEREAVPAERAAVAAQARDERETAAAEQRRLMAEVYE